MTRGKSQGGAREQSCSELRGGVGGILQVDYKYDCVVYLYKYPIAQVVQVSSYESSQTFENIDMRVDESSAN